MRSVRSRHVMAAALTLFTVVAIVCAPNPHLWVASLPLLYVVLGLGAVGVVMQEFEVWASWRAEARAQVRQR